MIKDPHFLLRGLIIFLILELLTYPLREPILDLLKGILPPPYVFSWECTGLDEVFLLISFIYALPGERKKKIRAIVLSSLLFEIFNVLRIILVVQTNNMFLHDVLFRVGGFLVVVALFYVFGIKYVLGRRR